MAIWEYNDSMRKFTPRLGLVTVCPFCSTKLIDYDARSIGEWNGSEVRRKVWTCPICGWWKIIEKTRHPEIEDIILYFNASIGTLKNLDLTDIKLPLEEVRAYLTAKFEKRFIIHPKLFEETVASVFSSIGYKAVTTAYSGDGGIDIILQDKFDKSIGVQVKRKKDKIRADQIRELFGALIINGYTKGIFVTTSAYQPGAYITAEKANAWGTPIELINGLQFLSILKIGQRRDYKVDFDALDQLYNMEITERIGTWTYSGNGTTLKKPLFI